MSLELIKPSADAPVTGLLVNSITTPAGYSKLGFNGGPVGGATFTQSSAPKLFARGGNQGQQAITWPGAGSINGFYMKAAICIGSGNNIHAAYATAANVQILRSSGAAANGVNAFTPVNTIPASSVEVTAMDASNTGNHLILAVTSNTQVRLHLSNNQGSSWRTVDIDSSVLSIQVNGAGKWVAVCKDVIFFGTTDTTAVNNMPAERSYKARAGDDADTFYFFMRGGKLGTATHEGDDLSIEDVKELPKGFPNWDLSENGQFICGAFAHSLSSATYARSKDYGATWDYQTVNFSNANADYSVSQPLPDLSIQPDQVDLTVYADGSEAQLSLGYIHEEPSAWKYRVLTTGVQLANGNNVLRMISTQNSDYAVIPMDEDSRFPAVIGNVARGPAHIVDIPRPSFAVSATVFKASPHGPSTTLIAMAPDHYANPNYKKE